MVALEATQVAGILALLKGDSVLARIAAGRSKETLFDFRYFFGPRT